MSIIYVIKVEVDPADEPVWTEWYVQQHVPDVLAQPGFIRAQTFKVDSPPGEWSQYLTLYELDSRESLNAYLDGDAVVELRADHYERFGGCTRLSRMFLTPIATTERATD